MPSRASFAFNINSLSFLWTVLLFAFSRQLDAALDAQSCVYIMVENTSNDIRNQRIDKETSAWLRAIRKRLLLWKRPGSKVGDHSTR